jgi:hypothetical protein
MKQPTNRDILTAVEGLTRDLHLFRDVTESRFGLMGERFDGIDKRFDGIDLTLGQHSLALTELAGDMTAVRATLAEHDRKFDRIETTLAEHGRTLAEHTYTLAEHGRLLADQRRKHRG